MFRHWFFVLIACAILSGLANAQTTKPEPGFGSRVVLNAVMGTGLHLSRSGTLLAAGTDGSILRSVDGGQHWFSAITAEISDAILQLAADGTSGIVIAAGPRPTEFRCEINAGRCP